jgi:2-haloacid dehalogenase
VFDLGGVLVDWDPRYLYRDLFGDDDAMEMFLGSVCNSEFNHELDRGRPFAEALAELAERHPNDAEMISHYPRWDNMIRGAMDDTVALLADLRGGVPIYALSNWSAETFPVARRRFEFLEWFDGIVLSGEEGLCKPEPEIFRVLCDRYGLTPSTTVFVDDVQKNVDAAADQGFDAVLFTTAAQLRSDLETRNLLD